MTFRWLHVSDFHTGKDGYGGDELFRQLVEHVRKQCEQEFVPHAVFITGDLAQSGKSEQFQRFATSFLEPLRGCLDEWAGGNWQGRLYAVPGNHDVDRDADFADRAGIIKKAGRAMFRPDQSGAKWRRGVLARFAGYRDLHPNFLGGDWLVAESAFFVDRFDVEGRSVGIAGLNTTWLAEDGHDESRLWAGDDIAREALGSLGDVDQKILLGHHPLEWLASEDREPLQKVLSEHRVIYLHGHLHEARAGTRFFRKDQYFTIQSGAGFQAHDSDQWVNGVLWGEIDCDKQAVRLQAREYDNVNGWVYGSQRFNAEDLDPSDGTWYSLELPRRDRDPPQAHRPGLAEAVVPYVPHPADNDHPAAPTGWTWIDAAWLDAQRVELSETELLAFFEGLTPK